MSASDTLPRYLDYRRAALDARRLSGVIGLDQLPRTREVVVAGFEAEVTVNLSFDEDAQRRVRVTGQAATTLSLPCQRCLAPADVPMDIEIAGMAVASDEAAASLPREWEPMLADGQTLDLHALIDDELLLALPITVHCDRAACRATYETKDPRRDEPETAPEEKTNPFAALAVLKQNRDDSTD